MKSFFEDQKIRMEKAMKNHQEETAKITKSVNNYFENQHKKVSADWQNCFDKIKENSKKVVDTWSFMPVDDAGSLKDNPEANLSVPGRICRNGYRCETHVVFSKGYLLNVHRIPHSTVGTISPKTVLLQHGLFASSADWILNGPEKALAYVLSDAGYDVWMSNVRGNRYSREHASFKTNSKSYWNFSWHDVAQYDLPAIIDYIMNLKGEGTKITYIGHSMGTTILFAMLSLKPEYNNILAAGIALAPVAFFTDFKSPVKHLAPMASNLACMEMLYGVHEFIPKNSPIGKLANGCNVEKIDSFFCKNTISSICGDSGREYDDKLLRIFLLSFGTGTSWKTMVHFAQALQSDGKFQQFDYGTNNKRMYGSDTPPEYDLSKVTLPLTLVWANNDLLSSEKDVLLLCSKLPFTPDKYLIPDPKFNHVDYLLSDNVDTVLNRKILKVLDKVYSEPETIRFPFEYHTNHFGNE